MFFEQHFEWRKKEDTPIIFEDFDFLKFNEVQAVQLLDSNVDEVVEWCGGVIIPEFDPFNQGEKQMGINLSTTLGMERAIRGFMIVKHDLGFSVVGPDFFNAHFEPKT